MRSPPATWRPLLPRPGDALHGGTQPDRQTPGCIPSINERKPPRGWALRSSPSVGNHFLGGDRLVGRPLHASLISTKVDHELVDLGQPAGVRNGSTASLHRDRTRAPTRAIALLFHAAHSMATFEGGAAEHRRRRWPFRVAVARSSISSRSPCGFGQGDAQLITQPQSEQVATSTLLHPRVARSSGAPSELSVQVGCPDACAPQHGDGKARIATGVRRRSAMPAPTTITRRA